MSHADEDMSDLYDKVRDDPKFRRAEAKRMCREGVRGGRIESVSRAPVYVCQDPRKATTLKASRKSNAPLARYRDT